MNVMNAGVRKSAGGLVFGMLMMGLSAVGCGGGSPPAIDDPETFVTCTTSGGSNVLDFVTYVDDPDGFEDVVSVDVDVYDSSVSTTEPVDNVVLGYDSNGEWSTQVTAADYAGASCENFTNLEFDFFAVDSAGDEDSVTYIPTPG